MISSADPHNLARFVQAQATDYACALSELRAGRKTTHWIWHVLPQMRALGRSPRALHYGIGSLDEARAYLAHPLLGPRLRECVAAMNALPTSDAVAVLGTVDATKFRSCLTLFHQASPTDAAFAAALQKFYTGTADPHTLALLAS